MAALTALFILGCTLLQKPEQPVREVVFSKGAPKPIGPYSQAVRVGNTLYCSGQIAIDPATGEQVRGNIEEETRMVLRNLKEVLKAAGMDSSHVVKATIFLANMDDYQLVNQIYAEFFSTSKPARETVQVARLPRDAGVEISCIAVKVD
ncbi:RidA family protein [Cytophagia bacterium CHB2]|nr:RidA family protein [Cytophagia bacterium CHB2]